MSNIEKLVHKAIVKTLKNHGLYQDLKGKVKFNRDKFHNNLKEFIDRRDYPAHVLNKIIDDSLNDMKHWREYQSALKYLNGMENIYMNRNNRRTAYSINVKNLVE